MRVDRVFEPLKERPVDFGPFGGFVLNEVDAVLADLRALGSVVLQAPTSMPWGVRAVVKDPDGRPVEVFVPVPDE